MRYRFARSVRRQSRVILGLLALTLAAVPADASKPRLRLERIDASRFESDGTVRVFASVVELEGNIDDGRAAPAFVLKMNGKSVGRPEKGQQFQGAAEALDLVLVVESSALYGPKKIVVPPPAPPPPPTTAKQKQKGKKAPPAPAQKGKKIAADVLKQAVPAGEEPLDKVKDAVHALLEGLSPRVRVLLIDYGADLTAHPPFRPAAAVSPDVDDLMPDGEAGDLALVKAINAALVELGKPRDTNNGVAPARRLVVVVSDGLNSAMDRKTFKALGDAAARARVPIHTIAFSPTDERGPLLNLGEISKRSNGTFRWARTAEDLRAQIDTLADELNKQYVLTYKIDARSLEGKTFQLVCEDLVSNSLVYDSSGGSFGYAPATRPLVPWWLWGLAGIVLFGGAAAVLIARARPKKRMKFSPYKNTGAQAAVAPKPATALRPVAPAPQPQPPPERAPTRGTLIVVSGALAGQRVDVGAQPVLIGKGPATLQITDDPTVSTRHAEVALRGGAFVVTDLGSTNGTFVNNHRLTQPTRLSDGDLLRCGNTQLKFRAE
jgi:FHA domain